MRREAVEPSDNTVLKGEFFFTNQEQFLKHTKKHIENVQELGDKIVQDLRVLFKEDPESRSRFDIPENADIEGFFKKFKDLMKIHDIAKISNDPEFLERYELKEPMHETLGRKAGQKLTTDAERKEVKQLNNIDKTEMERLKDQMGLKDWERNLSEKLEQWCDFVERGNNPIAGIEFDKVMDKASAYSSRPDEDNDLVLGLESYYDSRILPQQLVFAEALLTPKEEYGQGKDNKKTQKNEITPKKPSSP